jgi:hydroxysqualene synthase
MSPDPISSAYVVCEQLAAAHYENFPVASRLLPGHMRPHIAAVYAFARAADDFADEGMLARSERDALLDGWIRRLHEAASVQEPGAPPAGREPAETVEIFLALGATIRRHQLPVSLFTDLISAFRQDITVTRYASWAELLDYCRRSANPVGRLVLRIAGYSSAELDRRSDDVCTALQLTNFWQDLLVDFKRGRVYLPEDTRAACGAREEDLRERRITDAWRCALGSASDRTRALFESGRPVCDAVRGRLRYELRATWLGGTRILDRLRASDYDVVRTRPALGPADLPWMLWRMVTWRN